MCNYENNCSLTLLGENTMKIKFLIYMCFILILVFNDIIISSKQNNSKIKKFHSMSLEELMNVKIITAGKIQ